MSRTGRNETEFTGAVTGEMWMQTTSATSVYANLSRNLGFRHVRN